MWKNFMYMYLSVWNSNTVWFGLIWNMCLCYLYSELEYVSLLYICVWRQCVLLTIGTNKHCLFFSGSWDKMFLYSYTGWQSQTSHTKKVANVNAIYWNLFSIWFKYTWLYTIYKNFLPRFVSPFYSFFVLVYNPYCVF